ncbi:hypothetical protein [Methylomicrobium sp. Wu6]|uniref:hypothetical protein n=1 Tax=Methylomicrobium sp. Wu6 TaxID=3107928 RepID=UPI002DD683DA|nr:hypothetical protein [Methylomicrobium sp. Wu6]MEC4748393.1 hypothetical protein [Methylomicrobium sp. Wu6]
MLNTRTYRAIAFCLQIISLFAGGQVAFAHTEVQSSAQEGTQADNALKIGHGCEVPGGKSKPVIAQSVVFPQADLSGVMNPGSLAGLIDTIQNKDIFNLQDEKLNAQGGVIGFYSKGGRLSPTSQGRVPFEFSSPKFLGSSCVKTLNIELAVADICDRSNPKNRAGKVNLWIPDNGSTYATEGAAQGIDGVGEPPVLVVHRDLINNPLDIACNGGTEMTITPTAAEIDINLGIPHFW